MKKLVDGFDQPVAVESVPLTVMKVETQHPEVRNALLTEIVPPKQEPVRAPRQPRSVDIKKRLSVKASDYSVGMLGGISNLQLKVSNSSPHPVDKIVLAVQYLKPNGAVVETGNYELYSLKPHTTRSLALPDSKRGVKVKYRITEVRTKEIKQI